MGARAARLAHRVQRDGDATPRRPDSIFIAAASTTFSRITKRRSRRPKACTGKQFVRYWLHCAHLLVDGQKMSKSLGNFYTLRDVIEKGYSGREVRYALMRVHYRAPLNFTWEGMEEARQSLARIDDWLRRLREKAGERGRASATFTPERHNSRKRSMTI